MTGKLEANVRKIFRGSNYGKSSGKEAPRHGSLFFIESFANLSGARDENAREQYSPKRLNVRSWL